MTATAHEAVCHWLLNHSSVESPTVQSVTVFLFHRTVGFGTQNRGLKPWMIALLIVLLLTVVAVTIGVLTHLLVSGQKMEYYHSTFKISDLPVNSNSGQNSTYQLKDLREMSENLVDEIFIDSDLNKHYIKNQVVRLTPEEDGVKADIIMVFQFPSTEQRALIKEKILSILNQKIRNTRALPINASSVQVNAMSSSTGKLTVQACCGKRVVPLIVNRIMSGDIVAKAAWPWQASLQRNNIHQCGATLISNTWLITAAHCFMNNANPRQWTVSFGTTINPPLMKRNVRRIIVHERYHSPAREYDIAVVQFSPRVTFTDDIRRVCLPEASASFQPNSTVYITGFGALFYGGESQNNLREAKLKIISDDVCKQPHVYGHDIKSGMFCAGYLEGIYDACRGDSGGPLVVKDLKDTWYLIGIVSWGDNCGQKNKPGVYTNVVYYRNWITSKTGL
ncbi:transmembrane protease serine 11A [Zalophus californianus]|uniref:Transmembrane protease serine 11A n=1 Tax=Zalophus californianus TaxID=9704 RepID=A0A6J2DJS0_ZALCA|nr:transmembrane protease serine 11A [Zalophus californianus]XP_027956369.1 transmembrane protease serine 11A-like [Eumetopias jubatus]